jgi:hypothetical protein
VNVTHKIAAPCLFLALACSIQARAQVPAPAQPAAKTNTNGLTPDQIEITQRIAADFKDLRAQIARLPDGQTRQQMLQTLTRLETDSRRFTELTAGTALNHKALSADDLAKLLRALKTETFDEKRLPILRAGAARVQLTSEQARTLVNTLASSDSRKRAAILLYPRVLDPNNYSLVLNVIPYASDRDDAVRAISPKQ